MSELDDILARHKPRRQSGVDWCPICGGTIPPPEGCDAYRAASEAVRLTDTPALVRLAQWARWITAERLPSSDGDWACAECKPESDMLEAGFRCVYHDAKSFLVREGASA